MGPVNDRSLLQRTSPSEWNAAATNWMHGNYLQAFGSTHDSRTFVLTIGPNPHSGGSRAGPYIIGQWGPFSKGLLLQGWKATATNRMYSSDLTAFGKKCCYFFVPFWCLVFDMSWCCTVLDLVLWNYFNHVNGAKCLIHINLWTLVKMTPGNKNHVLSILRMLFHFGKGWGIIILYKNPKH